MIELKLSCFKVIVSYLSLYLSISAYFVIMLPIRALALILLALASFSNRSSSPFVIRMLLMSVLSFVDVGNYLQTCYISHYNISSVIIINVLQFEIFKGMCKTRKRSKRNNPIINRIAFSVSYLDQAIK